MPMNLVLFDSPDVRPHLLPFTYTRPVAHVRCGILTIAEKWEHFLKQTPSFLTQDYLQEKFPLATGTDNLFINGAVCPEATLVKSILSLQSDETLFVENILVASRTPEKQVDFNPTKKSKQYEHPVVIIDRLWKIFSENGAQLKQDYHLITKGRQSKFVLDDHTAVYNVDDIFLEDGVQIRAAILNAEDGPIYLGKNTSVQEGAIIKGPFALCEGSAVSMGAKMRGATTIGPFSKVGGEVSNSVIFGYSNKAHDGFIGNTVIGEWCNLGADTNVSNLKNNYDNVKIWSHAAEEFTDTGLQFCGTFMGDHSKCGINTMLNTGTVMGVACNIFGGGFPKTFIPSFTWGGDEQSTHILLRAMETAGKVMARRAVDFTALDKNILQQIFKDTRSQRSWEK